MIHRLIDSSPAKQRLIPFVYEYFIDATLSGNPLDFYGIGVGGIPPQGGAFAVITDGLDVYSSDGYADPNPSPDYEFVVGAFMNSGGANELFAHAADGSLGGVGLGTPQPSLLFTSMQPWWSKDATKIVYRTLDNSPNDGHVRTLDIDTTDLSDTNDQIVKTIARTGGDVLFPTWNYDGTKIVYGLNIGTSTTADQIWCMNADGSGAIQIATGPPTLENGNAFAVANTQNVVAYTMKNGSSAEVRKVNLDGTGDTLLYTDTTPFWGLTRRAWAEDDSALFYFRRISTTVDPQFLMYLIDPAGGGASVVDASFTSYGNNNDALAFVYGDRVYWQNADTFNNGDDHAVLVSCRYDGSGFRTELEFATGFPANYSSMSWVGGFAGFSNQPT